MSNPQLITLELPLPPARLSPNRRPVSRIGRIIAAKEIRSCRGIAHMLAKRAIGQQHRLPWPGAVLKTTWYLKRRRDGDNLLGWFKAYRDGLADAGIVFNDRDFIETAPQQFLTLRDVRVVVELERVDTA